MADDRVNYKVPYPMVRVEWLDSTTNHGWSHPDARNFNLRCVTVAFLLEETEDRLLIADSIGLSGDSDPGNNHCPQEIPLCAVTRMVYLTEKRK